jgi:hypothetical protein
MLFNREGLYFIRRKGNTVERSILNRITAANKYKSALRDTATSAKTARLPFDKGSFHMSTFIPYR